MTSAGFLQKLKEHLAEFELRPSQQEMLAACERVVTSGGTLLVEAPTGVGKTFAYAIPAILSGKRTIISTNKKNLQDQLIQKDLPLLARVKDFRFSVAKGFSNYLCLLSLHGVQPKTPTEAQERARLLRWAETTEDGEQDSLVPPSPLWDEVRADSAGCLRQDCPYYDQCLYFRARERWFGADLLVVNHALLAADAALALEAGRGLLPDAEILIIDEAHALEDAFSSAFTRWVSRHTLENLIREVTALDRRLAARAHSVLSRLQTLAPTFFEQLRTRYPAERRRVAPEEFALRTEAELLLQTLVQLQAIIEDFLAKESPTLFAQSDARAHLVKLRKCAAWVAQVGATLLNFLEPIQTGSPLVRWTESSEQRATLSVAPLSPKTELHDGLLSRFGSIILTSATLSVGEDFSYIRKQLGIEGETLALASSFDYARQVRLCLHRLQPPERGNPSEKYWDELARRIARIVESTGGGALVLFTNARVLDETARRLRESLHPSALVLCQGEESRSQLLSKFRADGNAVLLGLDSFWEGIDVPGPALRTVIITKIPFEVPDDPVHEARVERLREEGRDPFNEYILPRAALKLKQGFGRLIRTATDTGEVHILDGRVLTRSYGRKLLQALPQGIGIEVID
ncbi:MAG: ATP-dependent DNA helicase [Candidatus Bipolaricaulota bacterium]|nr:ATP-dependent DNA helicase [Candidatus Bipolaricaulota bacterium]